MRSRKSSNDQVAEVARRRLELLSAELAAIRRDPGGPPTPPGSDGSGEPPAYHRDVRPLSADAPAGRHARRPAGPGSRALGWLYDRLPPALQGNVRLGAPQLSFLALVVAVAMGALAWWAVHATGGSLVPSTAGQTTGPTSSVQPLVTPATAASVTPATPPVGPAAAGASADTIVIDVAGKVRDPGIATLPAGSRVVDALDAAGGPRRGVDLRTLNLARLLVDGEQILVGVPAPAGAVASAASGVPGGPAPLVSLNRAGPVELETLPGVGPVTAQAIIQWRAEHGAFSAVEELLEISGIGDATLAEIAPFVTL